MSILEQTEAALAEASATLDKLEHICAQRTQAALEAAAAVEIQGREVRKLQRALAVLKGEDPEPQSTRGEPEAPADARPGGSEVGSDAAPPAPKPRLEDRKPSSDAPDTPAPASAGPKCPSCGTRGSMQQTMRNIGDRGPFTFVTCIECGNERFVG